MSKRTLYIISLSVEKSLFDEAPTKAGRFPLLFGKYWVIFSAVTSLVSSTTDICSAIFRNCLILPGKR